MRRGIIITFEGGDGSGKGTQSQLFVNFLKTQNIPVRHSGFPQYDTPTGKVVGSYLRGEFGANVPAQLAGPLYSLNRWAAKDQLNAWLDEGFVVVLDRYSDSNKGHQGGKLATKRERIAYFNEIDTFEHDTLGLPRAAKTILFPMPAALAQAHVDKKNARSYTTNKRDIHETDTSHLKNANEAFLLLAKHEPERFIVIDPVNNRRDALRPIDTIQKEVQVDRGER